MPDVLKPKRNATPPADTAEVPALLQRLVMLFVLMGAPELAQRILRIRWSSDTPEIASAAADVLSAVPAAFQHMTVTAKSLGADIAAAEQAAEIKQTIDKLQRWATARLSDARARLYDNTQTAVDAISAARDSQLLPAKVRGEVTVAAGELDSRLEARSAGLKTTRRTLRGMRAEADERVAEVEDLLSAKEMELSISRGQSPPSPEAATPPAARSSRKRPPKRRSPR